MKYKIIKKGIESPKYFIEIEGNHGMCFGYVGGYRGYDFRDSLEECQKDLEKLMLEDKLDNERWNKENHREVVFEKVNE